MRTPKTIVDLSCAVIALCAVSSAFAQSDAQFAKANQEYAQGQFKEALQRFEAACKAAPEAGECGQPLQALREKAK